MPRLRAEGFDYGFAGHLTIRDPEHPELYWTNPMAVHFSQVKVSNLILADHEGKVVEGRHAINRAGFVLHAAVHEAHPDIVAMCHAHTVYGTAFAALGRPLDPITQDAAAFFEDHVVIKDEAGQVAVEVKAGQRSRATGSKASRPRSTRTTGCSPPAATASRRRLSGSSRSSAAASSS